MKLTKISLAALIALGAFSSVASATPLEEAIKNVDVSGMARYRYTNTRERAGGHSGSESGHGFKIITDFKAAIDDNFFGVLGLRYNATDDSGSGHMGTNKTNTDSTFNVYKAYLGYTIGKTTVIAGKQDLGTFFDDDAIGTGIKILNQDIEGLTLAAVAFDALENLDGETDGDLFKTVREAGYDAGNLYGAAIIGSYDPISFQLWYATVTNAADLIGVELVGSFDITDDVNVGFTGQYINNNADSKLKGTAGYNDGNYYAFELSTGLYGADLSAGYIGWKAKDYGATSFSIEDKGHLIAPGEQLFSDEAEGTDYTFAKGKGDFWFVTLGYGYDKFYGGVDYINGKVKLSADDKIEYEEIMPKVSYQYNKKLKFSSFYSFLTKDVKGEGETKQEKLRFEAKYSF
ncbi:major outer membrane protein [Campylobacter sp. faydin G-24]|uniref:Major outer membrane protein n=1 Tax=Campylobacter anatolicus TaxID=2829105 RepID=A0ABS5HJX0_9BACT|nr:major outer membrane protein [Campylobacter anatolicus]MBR8464553.1 major outer membrane protein [Campylobacter anatolicus]